MFSIWEQTAFLHYDTIVIGSGITGLSCALQLAKANPNHRIAILERGLLPSGASTKNAGFACIGSFTEKKYDLELMGEDLFLQLIENRKKGLERLRNELGDGNIDFRSYGGYELITESSTLILQDEIDELNNMLSLLFDTPVFEIANQKIHQFGFQQVKQLIENKYEGQINTGKMMRALISKVTSMGVNIITGAEVIGFEESASRVKINCKSTIQHLPVHTFTASKVAVCTNAFLHKWFSKEDITPGRGQVVCTKPISNLLFKGVFSIEEGYYYFRNFENRVLFGGGRNRNFEGEQTTEFGNSEIVINSLMKYLEEVILPNTPFEIDLTWSGIMAFGKQKQPIIKRVSENMVIAGRLNGMGVAIGMQVGVAAANELLV
jgi:glycine/D-amino acid oxidase-like deaminating enzyme